MSGALAFSLAMLMLDGSVLPAINIAFLALALITFIVKMSYFLVIGKPDGSTINTATGFSQAQVRLLDAGHNADTFLTKEFVFDAGAKKLLRLRWLMIALTFVLPVALIIIASLLSMSILTFFAMLSVYAGLFVERWLFFAEARHVVRLYHGDQRT
jgi:DMSO reductase anchor subunit